MSEVRETKSLKRSREYKRDKNIKWQHNARGEDKMIRSLSHELNAAKSDESHYALL